MKAALWTTTLLLLAGDIPAVVAQPAKTTEPGSKTSQSAPATSHSAPAKDSDEEETGVVVNLQFDVSNSSQGHFIQLVPEVGYRLKSWGLDFGVPFASDGASGSAAAAASHRGVGDMYLSVFYSANSDAVDWISTLTGTAPTGDANIGLGTGKANWNWTNHFDHDFDWINPFIDVGIGNSLNAIVSAGIAPKRSGRYQPYLTVGKLANLDGGVELQLSRPLGFSLSAYDIIPWGDQTVLSRFTTQSNQPGSSVGHGKTSRSKKGQRPFEVSRVTRGTALLTRDNGFDASVTVSPKSYFDLTVQYSRSVPMKLDILSVSIGTNLTRLFK